MNGLPAVRRVSHEDVAEAAEALARAFQDDPIQTYIFPDPDERQRLSPVLFSVPLEYGLRFGAVHAGEGGAIVALPPGATEINEERAEQGGITRLADRIGPEAAARFLEVLGVAEQMHARHASGPHWYVMVLGVSPDIQGTGLGRALLQSIFAEADAARLPVYLETAQPRNIAFYGHMGFAVVEQVREPKSGLDIWGFLRPPLEVSAPVEPARRPRPRRRYQGRR
jgi:GNAT superfamily N-acetyltransferase